MSRYRLEIQERYTVTKTTVIDLDADSPEEAETLLFEQLERFDTPLTDADTLFALRAAQVRIRSEEEEWEHEERYVVEATEIAELPDPRQGVLFA